MLNLATLSQTLLPFGASNPLDPISQFEIKRIADLRIGNFDISFTNSGLMMLVALGLTILWLTLGTRSKALVPGRSQSIVEVSYEFIANMIRSSAGPDGLRFFPFVYALFIFILFANMLGMFPVFFTTTSHLIVTFALAMMVMLVVVGYGLFKHGFGFFKLFWPSGVPLAVKPLVSVLEVISFLSRPISLSIRLWANVLAGHILLKLFAGFAVVLAGSEALGLKAISVVPFVMTFALVPLEFLVSFVQAFVFALLTCVYLSDALHPGHH